MNINIREINTKNLSKYLMQNQIHKISMKSIPQKEKDGYEQIFSLFEIAKNKYAHSKL